MPYLYATPSRPRRRARRVPRVLFAVAVALAAVLILPGAGHVGEVADLGSAPPEPAAVAVLGGGEIAGSSPAPVAGSASPSPSLTPTPSPSPSPDPTPAAPETLTGYEWPLAHARLTLPFGPTAWGTRIVNGKRFHDGVDLATFCGDRITAAHDGIVIAAGRRFDRVLGWVGDLEPYFRRLNTRHLWFELPIVVVIDDGNGYRSVYAHFERIKVETGQEVHAGQLLGWEGATGHASGCHLHYSLFSPLETATFRIRGDVVKRLKLPDREIARIDPLPILPPRKGINAPKEPKGSPAEASGSPGPGAVPPSATSP